MGTVVPAFWFQFFLNVGVTTHPTNTFSFFLARRASSKEFLSGFCYPCIFEANVVALFTLCAL